MNVQVERKKLSDLIPADYNPRTITDKAFQGLGKSMDRFGLLSVIVWNKRSGNIVGGHQRYKHLVSLGEQDTDVVVVDLNSDDEVALNIALNNPKIRGDFTKGVLDQLRESEASLGKAFDEIGLQDLYHRLSDMGLFDEDKPREKKRDKKKDKTTSSTNGSGGENVPPPSDNADRPSTVIVCPSCRSQWRLKDNYVVYNAVTGIGNPVGVDPDAGKTVEDTNGQVE